MLIEPTRAPVHETPNAVMRTLAAPSLGSTELSVWEVSMKAGQRGPEHEADREQIWTVLEGAFDVQVAGVPHSLQEGSALRIAPKVVRQITATTRARALVASVAGCSVTPVGEAERPLPWAS
jgi:quercetin dioxygenase-like cupin family protein